MAGGWIYLWKMAPPVGKRTTGRVDNVAATRHVCTRGQHGWGMRYRRARNRAMGWSWRHFFGCSAPQHSSWHRRATGDPQPAHHSRGNGLDHGHRLHLGMPCVWQIGVWTALLTALAVNQPAAATKCLLRSRTPIISRLRRRWFTCFFEKTLFFF